MKKILTFMLACLMGFAAVAGNRHTVKIVTTNENLQFSVTLNDSQKSKAPANKMNLNRMRPNKDYKVVVQFDNIKIMHPMAELTLTNVTEDMELVAFIEGQQAYLMTRADYDAAQKAIKAKQACAGQKHSCGGCNHSCGGHSHAAQPAGHDCSKHQEKK